MRQSITIFLLFIYIIPAVLSAGAREKTGDKNRNTVVCHSATTEKNGCPKNIHIPCSPAKQPVKAKAPSHTGHFISSIPLSSACLPGVAIGNTKYFIPDHSRKPVTADGNIWQPPRSC